MTTGVPEGKVHLGFNAPTEMAETLDKIAIKRWGKKNRTDLLHEAVSRFIEREENPVSLNDEIRRAMREEPALVSEAMEIYEARKNRKK